MREARAAALAAGVTAWSLRSVDAGVSQAELLVSRSEFADATRMLLEARDAFDRSRRAALARGGDTRAGRHAAVAQAPHPPARPRGRRRPRLRSRRPATPAPPRPPALPGRPAASAPTPRPWPPRRPAASRGFDSSEVDSRRPPQFAGRLEFEVLPPEVRPGEPFVVRIHLRNDGRRPVKIRGLSLAAVVDGRPVTAPVTALQREVVPQGRALVAEYSGVWSEAASWALEAVVTADRDERITSRLRAN